MPSRWGVMRGGTLAALGAAMLTIIWLVMLVALPAMPEDASLEDEIFFIAENQAAHITLYGGVFLLALVQVPFFLALIAVNYRRQGDGALLWGLLAFMYIIFSLSAYWTQLTVVRGLADLYMNSEDATLRASAVAGYLTWGYNGRLAAAPYAFDSLGYLVYSLALMGFGSTLVREPGIDLVSGGLLLLASVSGLIGVLGYLMRVPFLEDGIVLSGAFVMPAYFTLAIRFWRESNLD